MEQTDAEAERHVFVFFCFVFQGLFWGKSLETISPRRLYIIRMCTLPFEHKSFSTGLLHFVFFFFAFGKTVTARV